MAAALIRLRYPTKCSACGSELNRGDQAHWDRENRRATCVRCLHEETVEQVLDRGQAGGSAAREWQHRHDRREQRIRSEHKHLGGLILALSDDPQSTQAWAKGARGEQALGRMLDRLRDDGMAVLHDRRIPGSRANIDHLVASRAGVFVVDAKNYPGRVEKRDVGGIFHCDERLYVGRRDRTKLVKGMAKQAAAVRSALAPEFDDVSVVQAICFVASEWPFFTRPLRFGEVRVLWPQALVELLRSDGTLAAETITQVERRLALGLPAA